MDLLDVLAYKHRMIEEHGCERVELEEWYSSLPDDCLLTKEHLQPLYNSQHWVLTVGANREAADCAHLEWRLSFWGWVRYSFARRFRRR